MKNLFYILLLLIFYFCLCHCEALQQNYINNSSHAANTNETTNTNNESISNTNVQMEVIWGEEVGFYSHSLVYYSNGNIKEGILVSNYSIKRPHRRSGYFYTNTNINMYNTTNHVPLTNDKVSFYSNGYIKQGRLSHYYAMIIDGDQLDGVSAGTWVRFYANGDFDESIWFAFEHNWVRVIETGTVSENGDNTYNEYRPDFNTNDSCYYPYFYGGYTE